MVRKWSWLPAILAAMILALYGWLSGAAPARAENLGPGGGTRVLAGDEIHGPYRLLVTASPDPAQIGTLTVLVRVSEPEGNRRVRDADVMVTLTHTQEGTQVSKEATHQDAGNDVDYVAHLEVPAAGVWTMDVAIDGPSGPAHLSFDQRVLAPRQLSTVLIIGIPFVVLLGVLGGLWYVRSGARAPLQS